MSKEQIILDVYREHCLEQSKYLRHGGTIQEFIDKCKTDTEFSERWGLKIEELELSFEERWKFYYKKEIDINNKHGEWDWFKDSSTKNLNSLKIPTKLITITYNDKIIESYE